MTIDASIDAVPLPAPVASPIAGLLTAPILPTLLRLAIPNHIAVVGSTLGARGAGAPHHHDDGEGGGPRGGGGPRPPLRRRARPLPPRRDRAGVPIRHAD